MEWDTNSKTCHDVAQRIYQIYVNNKKINLQSSVVHQYDIPVMHWLQCEVKSCSILELCSAANASKPSGKYISPL